jgi:hypothetical protein
MAVMQPNMGFSDRLSRGLLGLMLLMDGLQHIRRSAIRPLETIVGGAFVFYGLTGYDPVLKKLGVSTIAGAEDNVLHQFQQVAPGQGINPMLTQQAVPQHDTRGMAPTETVAKATAIA